MGLSGYLGELDTWPETPFSCITCGEAVLFASEIFCITVVQAQLLEGQGMQYSPVIYEDHDFLYEPSFLCDHCWGVNKEELSELVRDEFVQEDPYAVVNCNNCHSGIRSGEVIGLSTFGRIHQSQRSPNGVPGGPTFETLNNDPNKLCISCINKLSRLIDELWSEPVKQFQECARGTELRCWRTGCLAEEDSCYASCNAQTG